MLELSSSVRSRYDFHKFLLIELRWTDDYLPDIDDEYNLFRNRMLFRVGLGPDQAGGR